MGVGVMREFTMILMFAGTFIFVVKQFAINIALVFEDEKNEKNLNFWNKQKGRK